MSSAESKGQWVKIRDVLRVVKTLDRNTHATMITGMEALVVSLLTDKLSEIDRIIEGSFPTEPNVTVSVSGAQNTYDASKKPSLSLNSVTRPALGKQCVNVVSSKIPGSSVKSEAASVQENKVYQPHLFITKKEALRNAMIWATRLEIDDVLWGTPLEISGCFNCQNPDHILADCGNITKFRRGTVCGACGVPGLIHEQCPFCYPSRFKLTPPKWYRGAKN